MADVDPIVRSDAQVTRNYPPVRVRVADGCFVSYGGTLYSGGQEFVYGEGPAAVQLALEGKVVIVDNDASEAWNGPEGRTIHESAMAHIPAADIASEMAPHVQAFLRGDISASELDKRKGAAFKAATPPTHDHGFGPYTGGDGIPMDLTVHRQSLAAIHLAEDRQMTEADANPSKKGAPE